LERISHYRILGRIGSGGMGEVHRGLDERLGREVAIKLLKVTSAGSAERQVRLLREAQAASALNHPGIVTVYDVGATPENRPFLVMELVQGRRFSDLGGIEPTEALLLCAQAADALAAAHARGILHRDIKSDNLMRLPDGRVKVLDFGLAKLSGGGSSDSGQPADGGPLAADPLGDTLVPLGVATSPTLPVATPPSPSPLDLTLTRIGDVIGTPAYMAPEQTEGKPADARSEVFSLGVVLYELIVGRRPFVGATVAETLELVRSRDPVPPSVAAGKASLRRVDRIVLRALAKQPADRHAGMRELAADLRRAAVPSRAGRRLAVAVALGILLVGAGAALRLRGATPPARPTLGVRNVHRLTRQEGCEEFPVWSADGRSVYYDATAGRGYALFAIDAAGGAPRRITNVAGWDLAPTVSPDGTRLAFLRRGEGPMSTWVAPLGDLATAHALGGGASRPAWSPDGRSVWTGGSAGIWRRAVADGAVTRTLVPPPDERPLMLRELGDGRLLVLYFPISGSSFPDGLAIYGPQAGTPTWLIRAELEEVLALTPAEDAVLVARETANANIEVLSVPLDGGNPQSLALVDVAPRKGLSLSRDAARMVWSDCRHATSLAVLDRAADGSPRLTDLSQIDWIDQEPVAIPGTEDLVVISDRGGSPDLWRMDRHLRRAAVPLGFGRDADSVAVSSDGKQLAFADDAGFWVAPLDGSAKPSRVLDARSESPPSFRRDGRALFIEGVDERKRPRIGEVPLGGGPPRWLLSMARAPAASPTEDVLAYLDVNGEAAAPRLYELKTGRSRPLAPALAGHAWSGLRYAVDGKRLLLLRSTGELALVEVASGRVLSQFDAGADQIIGGTLVGDEIVVGRSVWRGDLWIAEIVR
jgi:aminoglycoside phosphotransferase (APT) family kinase protein